MVPQSDFRRLPRLAILASGSCFLVASMIAVGPFHSRDPRVPPEPDTSPEAAVRAGRADFNHAIAPFDSGQLATVLADSVTFVSHSKRYLGRSAVISRYRNYTGGTRQLTLTFEPREVTGAAPFVTEYGTFAQQWHDSDDSPGAVRKMEGRYFAIWALEDGRWRMLVQSWSPTHCNFGPCES